VQTALTGQKVEARSAVFSFVFATGVDTVPSFPLENIKHEKYTSFGGKLSRFLRTKGEKKEGHYKDLGPGNAQLWSEGSDEEEVCRSIACRVWGSADLVARNQENLVLYLQLEAHLALLECSHIDSLDIDRFLCVE
jgi:hypothetical protein